jgi:hypothetical protein
MEKNSGGNFIIHDLDFWIFKILKSQKNPKRIPKSQKNLKSAFSPLIYLYKIFQNCRQCIRVETGISPVESFGKSPSFVLFSAVKSNMSHIFLSEFLKNVLKIYVILIICFEVFLKRLTILGLLHTLLNYFIFGVVFL